jgi:hypothetical protein
MIDHGGFLSDAFFVIASASEAIHGAARRKNGLLRRFAPVRKRFAFVAGNDARLIPHAGAPDFTSL